LKRFYWESTKELDGKYFVLETEGGNEHGAYFDVSICVVDDVGDAEYLCDKLNYLYELTKKEQ
jgi:hypothetical protein